MTSTTPQPKKGLSLRLILILISLVGLNLLVSLQIAQWSFSWLPVAASTAAPYVDGLFSLEVGMGAFLFNGCVGFILWSVIANRAEKYDESDGLPIEGNTKLEIIWTVIPLIIVMALAIYSIDVNGKLDTLGAKNKYDMAANQSAKMVASLDENSEVGPIEVISRQWNWEFIYPNGVRSSELHLPINQRANFLLISKDVIHSFYIPAFRLKQDIIPGSVISYSITPTREGRYRLRDAHFSGAYFSENQTHVIVQSEEDYSNWLQSTNEKPLVPGLSPGTVQYQKRLSKGNKGWATVPPAPPPMVNDPGNPDDPHEA